MTKYHMVPNVMKTDSYFCLLSSGATPGHREPCAETNARVGIKFAAQNVIDVSTVVALS